MVLRKKIMKINEKDEERIRQPLDKPPDILGPSNKPAQHTVRRKQEEEGEREKCARVYPHSKGTSIQDNGRPWYKGCGTIQE